MQIGRLSGIERFEGDRKNSVFNSLLGVYFLFVIHFDRRSTWQTRTTKKLSWPIVQKPTSDVYR